MSRICPEHFGIEIFRVAKATFAGNRRPERRQAELDRPPGPEPESKKSLSHRSGVTYGILNDQKSPSIHTIRNQSTIVC